MGTRFQEPPPPDNPDGDFEDLNFKELNVGLVKKEISFPTWYELVKTRIAERREIGQPWGIKNPIMAYMLGCYLEMVPDAVLIKPIRDAQKVIVSCCRCYGWAYKQAMEEILRREQAIDLFTRGRTVHSIDFNSRRTDEEVIQVLEKLVR
jgi:hypothetical protein